MASDIYIAMGADTGEMEAGLARAQAAVRQTAAEMRSLASEMVKTGAATDSELGARLAELGSKLADAKEHVTGFKEELKGTEGEGFIGGMVEKVKDFLAPLNSLKLGLGEMTEAVAAAFAVEKVVEFIKSMGELGEQTERTAAILGITTEQVGELNYAFTISGTSTENMNRTLARFELGLAKAQSGVGPVAEGLQALGLSASELIALPVPEQLEKIADAVSKFGDSATKTAAVQALGRGFVELLPMLDKGSQGFKDAAAAAQAAGVVLNDFSTKELVDTQHGLVDLGQSVEGLGIQAFLPLTDAVNGTIQVLRDLMQAFIDSARSGGDLAGILYAISEALRVVATAIAAVIQLFKMMGTEAAGALNSINDYFQGLGKTARAFFTDLLVNHDLTFSGMKAASAEANAKVAADFAGMTKDVAADLNQLDAEFKKIWKGFGDEAEDAAKRANDAVAGVHSGFEEGGAGGAGGKTVPEIDTSPWAAATREVEALTEQLKAVEDALAGRKTSVDTSFFESRGHQRGAAEEAPIFADALEKAIKDAEAATGSKATFTSLARTHEEQQRLWEEHQRTGKPAVVAPPGTSMHEFGGAADLQAGPVLDWLRAHISQYPLLSDLSNPNDPGHIQFSGSKETLTASKEAAARAPTTGEPPTGEERQKLLDKQKELNLELDKAKQKLLDIKTEEAGGTATSKAKLDIDIADAKAKGDAVANAKELQAAAEADLDAAVKNGATQERILKLRTEVAKATEAVTAAEQKAAEAAGKLEVEKAKAAGDIEKEKAAELALADLKIKAAGADKAARDAAEAEKIAIEKRYADQATSLAVEKGNEEIQAAHTKAANAIKDIDLEFRAKQISESQKVALTKAALAEEIATERSVYAQELALDNLRPAERQKILAQLAAAEEKYAQQVKETQLKAAEDSAKAWQSMADKVAGVLNSQVSGILSGTTTIKQAFSNMAKSIIEDVAKYAIKWAVEHAFAATQVMAQNQAVTASTIAGQTAQDAAKTASSGVGIAMQAADAVKSIAIDGAKTFGGVFGFLAPLLGPFAAGPAAGAQATVLAAGAAFDTGAWNLPRDMIAAVHAGEMVIPSRGGVADEFRSFMSEGGFNRAGTAGVGAPAGGNKSVSVNPAVHFNVSAIDGQSAASFFQSNHKAMMSAVDRAVRHGSALGLRAFNR